MIEASKSSTCEEAISDNTDVDTIDDSDNDFGLNVTDRIVWGKPICSRRFLDNLTRTLKWDRIMKSRGYQLVKAACKQVQRDSQ